MKPIDPNDPLITYEEALETKAKAISEAFMQWGMQVLPTWHYDEASIYSQRLSAAEIRKTFGASKPLVTNQRSVDDAPFDISHYTKSDDRPDPCTIPLERLRADPVLVKPDIHVRVDPTKYVGQLGPNPAIGALGKPFVSTGAPLKAWRDSLRQLTLYRMEYDDWYYGISDKEDLAYHGFFGVDLHDAVTSGGREMMDAFLSMKVAFHAYPPHSDTALACQDGSYAEVDPITQAPPMVKAVATGPWYLGNDDHTPEEVLAEEYPLDEPTAIEGPLSGGKWVVSFGDQATVEVTAKEVCEAGGSAVDAARKQLEGKSRGQSLPEDDAS